MNRQSLTRLLGIAGLVLAASGCDFQFDYCQYLTESSCIADPRCEPTYIQECACPACAPGAGCPECNCQGTYSGCHEGAKPPPPMLACESLDESTCLARPDCEAEYYEARCGTPPVPDSLFKDCKTKSQPGVCEPGHDETCNDNLWMNALAGTCRADGSCACSPGYALNPATGKCGTPVCTGVACHLYCPGGNVIDANGCPTCECIPVTCSDGTQCAAGQKCLQGTCADANACVSDADCSGNQKCEGLGACMPGTKCEQSFGFCIDQQTWCSTDADCATNQQCIPVDCGPNMDCASQGVCQTAPRCSTDAECPTGYRCPRVGALYATCERELCGQDSDCRAGETCDLTEAYTCGPTEKCAGRCVATQTGCFADSDCPVGQVCSLPELICPPGTMCPQPAGICVVPPSSCQSDADCRPGYTCQNDPNDPCSDPNSLCPRLPAKICVGTICSSDADCSGGQVCKPDPTDPCNSDPTVQCFAAGRMTCQNAGECQSNADCATDQVCLPDPSDLCNSPAADCFRIGRRSCQTAVRCMFDKECAGQGAFGLDLVCRSDAHLCPDPNVVGCMPACQDPCSMLTEAGCKERLDCHAVYTAIAGTPNMTFAYCQ